jgi:hypothetical protein
MSVRQSHFNGKLAFGFLTAQRNVPEFRVPGGEGLELRSNWRMQPIVPGFLAARAPGLMALRLIPP